MAFIRPTLIELITRVENDITSRLTGFVALLQKALLKIMARVFSGGFDSVYGHQQFIALQITVSTASEEWVRRYAFQWDVDIQDATFASGLYTFTGTDGVSIPLSTILFRSDNVEYITKTSGTIVSGVFVATIECRESGVVGNAGGGTSLNLESPIIGVNTEGFMGSSGTQGGIDGDDVEDIRENVLNRMKFPPMGGSVNDYKVIAEGVAGIDKAFPYPNQAILALIPGSVTVVCKGEDPIIPSASLLQDVLDALNAPSFKPLTSTHFTAAIVPKTVDFTISITPNVQDIQDTITKNLTDVFETEAIPGGTILITHIQNAISTSGITNYTIDSIVVEDQGSVPIDQDISFVDFDYPTVNNFVFNTL